MAHINQQYWQGVSDQMFQDVQKRTLSFKVRVRKVAHTNKFVKEVKMSNEEMNDFVDWMKGTLRSERG
jgi:hypothetical protein